MKVKVYLPEDVPDGFKYGVITNDYVELFNKSSFKERLPLIIVSIIIIMVVLFKLVHVLFLVIHQLIMASFQSHVIF